MFIIKMVKFMFMRVLYRMKYQPKIQNFPKLVEVVMSCDTPEHCTTAMHYIRLYEQQTVNNDSGFGIVTKHVLGQMIAYLQNTAEHYEKGFHKPKHNGYKTTTTYPDMNDYLGAVLSMRFTKAWTRGKCSVISTINS